MPARHRRLVTPRQLNKRVLGAGASGLALALAAAPLAHAAQPAQPSTDTATSAAPSSPAPSPTDPSSPTPLSPAPSSTSSAPTSSAPSSSSSNTSAPSSSSSSAPSSSAPSSSGPKAARPKALGAQAAPDYGARKIYVGAQLKDGSYYPNGTTTVGSTIQIVETGPSEPGGPQTQTCTTAAPNGPGSSSPGDSSCYGFLDGYKPAGNDTVTITQLTATANTILDPMTFTSVPCVTTADPDNPDVPLCSAQSNATFINAGVPPSVTEADTTVTVPVGTSSTVDVDGEQIDTHGAPPTSVDVTTDPTHGTVAVVSDTATSTRAAAATPVTGAFHFVYTPTNGYAGPDSFAYTESTANGTAGPVTVSLRVVGPAPTARDDSATTKEGAAVSVDALANDDANGGGTLALDSVTTAQHGSAAIVDGTLRYTPTAGFSGSDSFDYTASTYSGTATATVRVTVTAPAVTSSASSSSSTTVPPANGNGAAPNTTGTADTGTPTAQLLEIAGGLLLAGAGTTVAGRRRRRSRSRHA